ncbi:MAG: GMC oxidoreductase [Polyangiaceae bacterium]
MLKRAARSCQTAITEVWPGPSVATDEAIAKFVRKESWGHHACCTNKMGAPEDETAVVDAEFHVIGAEHLRVVDASVFPEIPGTFIAMPTYMLAEKAADAILEGGAR